VVGVVLHKEAEQLEDEAQHLHRAVVRLFGAEIKRHVRHDSRHKRKQLTIKVTKEDSKVCKLIF